MFSAKIAKIGKRSKNITLKLRIYLYAVIGEKLV